MARTTTNGGDQEAEPFVTVAHNTQTPVNPRGNTTVGDFELQWTVEAPFSFPGGGLIIRFSNPSAGYLADGTCTQVLVWGEAADTSGYFVKRVYFDANGVYPWDYQDGTRIGAFR